MKHLFFTRWLMMLVFIIPLGLFAQTTTLLDEDFSELQSGIPLAWDRSSSTIANFNNWKYYSDSEGICLNLNCRAGSSYANNLGDKAILMTPSLNFASAQTLSFRYKANSTSIGCDFYVYISTDGGNTYVQNEIAKITPQATWTNVEFDLSSYPNSNNVKIVFYAEIKRETATNIFIDNIKVSSFPQCATPVNLSAGNILTDQATLNWGFHQWGTLPSNMNLLVYDKNNNVVKDEKNILVIGNSFNITGLQPSTLYYAKVQSDCETAGKGKSVWSETISFTTLCLYYAIPFSNNFENEENTLPLCWNVGGGNAGSIKLMDKDAVSGKVVRINSTSTNDAFIATPLFKYVANNIELSFKIMSETLDANYQVLVMTDLLDNSTAVPLLIETLPVVGVWQDVVVNTSDLGLEGEQDIHIVFYSPKGKTQAFLIDDVNITSIPTCIRPSELNVTNIKSTSATFDWVSENSNWQIRISGAGNNNIINTTTRPFDYSGLNPSSEYSFSVRQICSIGDTSAWSSSFSFTTPCSPISVFPFREGFNDVVFPPNCWTSKQTVRGTEGIGSTYEDKNWVRATGTSSIKAGTGSAQLKLTKKGTHSILALPPMYIPTANTHELRFWIKRDSNNYTEGLKIWVNTSVDTIGGTKLGFVGRSKNITPIEKNGGWYQYTFPITISGDQLFVMFEGISLYGTSTYIDEIEVQEIPVCKRVTDIKLDSTKTTSAFFSWTKEGDETEWEISYKTNNFQSEYIVTRITNTPQVEILNLMPSRPYSIELKVKSICSATEYGEELSYTTNITTDCLTKTLPYVEDFDEATITNGTSWSWIMPFCWTIAQKSSSTNPTVTINKDVRFDVATTSINSIVSPKFELDSWVGNRIRFEARADVDESSQQSIIVGLVSSPDEMIADINNMQILDTIKVLRNGVKETYIINITKEYSQRYIVFRSNIGNKKSVYIDNINVEPTPLCSDLKNVIVSNVDKTTATVDIVETTSATAWEIEYGVSPMQDGNTTIIPVSTLLDNPLTNLVANTRYDVRARAICGNDKGLWSPIATFTTKCLAYTVDSDNPFFEGFEESQINQAIIGGCWTTEETTSSSSWIANSSLTNYGRKPYEGSFNASLSTSREDYMFIALDLKANANYRFSCFARKGSSTTVDYAHELKVFITENEQLSPTEDILVLSNKNLFYSTTTYRQEKDFFTVPADGEYYLAIGGKTAKYAYISIDNIKVEDVSCAAVSSSTIIEERVTSDSVYIKWTHSAPQFIVKVSKTSIDPLKDNANVYIDTVADQKLVLGHLNSNTQYYYYIQSYCDNAKSEWTEEKSFRTLCNPYSIPFKEDFDSINTSLECWTAADPLKQPTIAVLGSPNKALKLSGVTVATPKLNIASLAPYQFSTMVYANKDNAVVTIGVVTDINDIVGTYEPISDYIIYNKNTWTEIITYFNSLDEAYQNANYIVLTVAEDYIVHFDNINVDVIPSCPKPSALIISNILDTKFDLSWNSNQETSWNVVLKNDDEIVKDTIVTSDSITIDDVIPNTNYSVSVRAICSVGDTSELVQASLKTLCPILVKLPYSENFEQYSGINIECWKNTNVDNSTNVNLNWRIKNDMTPTKAASYYSYNTKGKWAILESPLLDLKNETNVELTFDYMNEIGGMLYVQVSEDNGSSYSNILTLGNDINTLTNYTVDLSSYSGKEVKIAFKAVSNRVSSSYIYIDNINVRKAITCIAPDKFTHLESTINTVKLNVESSSENNTWEAVLVQMGQDINSIPESELNIITSTSNVIEFTDFNYASRYYAAVRRVCGGENSAWIYSNIFATACSKVLLPYENNFEDVDKYEDVLCFDERGWLSYLNYPRAEIETVSYYALDGSRSLKLYSGLKSSLFITLPQMSVPVENLNIEFIYKNKTALAEGGKFTVGLMPLSMDTTQFITVAEITRSSIESKNVNFDLRHSGVTGTDYYITLRYLGAVTLGKELYIDNIKVTLANDIPVPLKADVRNIELNHADIVITDDYNSAWDIAYASKGTNMEDFTIISNVTEILNRIEGLNQATEYEFYVRGRNGDKHSDWTRRQTFVTDCGIIFIDENNPYVQNFDAYDKFISPSCWTVLKGNIDELNKGIYPTCQYSSKATSKDNILKFYLINGGKTAENIIALPTFSVPLNKTVLSLYANGTYSELVVGYTNDLNNLKACKDIFTIKGISANAKRFEVDLTGLPSDAKYVYLKLAAGAYGYVEVDDVTVSIASTCTSPKDISIIDILDESVKVTYRSSEDNNRVEVEYVNMSMLPLDTISMWTTLDTVDLLSLVPNSIYSLRLRSECLRDGNLDTTEWSDNYLFKTYVSIAEKPYHFDFETADTANWIISGQGKNQWLISNEDARGIYQGDKALYISKNNADNAYDITSASTSYAYRNLYIEAGQYNLSYMIKNISIDAKDYVRVFLVPFGLDMNTITETNKNIILTDNGEMFSIYEWLEISTNFTIKDSGYYNLAFYWKNNNNSGYQTPAAIDNIKLEPLSCMKILNINPLNIEPTEAVYHIVDNNAIKATSYSYVIKEGASSTFSASDYDNAILITSDTLKLSGLKPLTSYSIAFRANCDNSETSEWSDIFSFTTNCLILSIDKDNPFVESFEETQNGTLDGCWMQHLESGEYGYKWEVKNEDPHTGNKAAALSTKRIVWLMREFYLSAENSYELKFFTSIGSVINSAPIISAGYTNDTSDLSKANMFEPYVLKTGIGYQEYNSIFSVPTDGIYTILIKGENGDTYKNLVIDDISIVELTCDKIQVAVDSISHDFARFSWSASPDSVRIVISGANVDTVLPGNITTFEVGNLRFASNYTLYINSFCGTEVGMTTKTIFRTECTKVTAPYAEDFEGYSQMDLPTCWDNRDGSLAQKEYKWQVYNMNNNKVMRFDSRLSAKGQTNILKSLPINVEAPIMLSFDYMNPSGGDLSFFVSTDGGVTYADTLKYNVKNITKWEKVYYPLNDYIGEDVTLVASSVSNKGDANAYHYLDNVRLVCHATKTINDTVCAGSPYIAHGFNVTEDKVVPGTYTYSRLKNANEDGECDTTITLELYVPQHYSIELHEAICEGDSILLGNNFYSKGGSYTYTGQSVEGCDSLVVMHLRVIPRIVNLDATICEGATYKFANTTLTEPGVYTDTLNSTMGCDSITVLTLRVIPKHYEETATICEGTSITFEGSTYTESGRYTKTFTNGKGCDSIRVLNLTVVPTKVEINEAICQGKSVFFAGDYRTTSGVYKDTMVNSLECDSIITLNLTVIPADTTIVNAYVCEGEEYYGNGSVGITITKDSILYNRLQTIDKCDSIIELHLRFSPSVEVFDTVKIGSGKIYEFGGNTLSTTGDYEYTFNNFEGCDSTVYLRLIVGGTSVNTIESRTLTLAPNPIERLGYSIIDRDWSIAEKEGMRMEVIDAVGKVLYSTNVKEFPIVVNNIAVSGIYYVRIITGTGETYIGKLIVK